MAKESLTYIKDYPRPEINFNPVIPPLKRIKDKTKIDVRYCLISPYAFVHIHWDPKIYEVVYEIEEPILTDIEMKKKDEIITAMNNMIDFETVIEKEKTKLLEYIDKRFKLLAIELGIEISYESYKKMFYYLCRDFMGFNETEPLLRDYFVEDIECNGGGTPVYIVHRVYRNLKTNLIFNDLDRLQSFVEKLAQRSGKYISYAKPILDGTLPDGSRVNATYTKDITSKGPTFCFKKGKVQLSDGRIKEVKELFEECKKNYGSVLEDGNEVVRLTNVNCLGVDEDNLEQTNSRMTSIIKVKTPEKLAKINFEDGGEVEVTLNHKFHVAGESLELIEAKDMKKGMVVPMPKKIIAKGYKQKINVYQLIKDFSYHKKVCLVSTPCIKEIITKEINSYPGERCRAMMSENYKVGNSYFYEAINRGSSVSFSVMDQICTKQGFDLSEMENIYINVYGGGTKGKSKTIKIPKEVNEDLAYLAGVLISDGHIAPNSIDFSCYEEGVKNSVKEKLMKLFGKFESYYEGNRIYLCNSFAPYFFNKVFGIPSGKKFNIVEIPEIILKSEDNVIASFIRGLFDGDGTASAGLSYKTFSKDLAEGLTYALSRLGISSYLRGNEKEFRVNIPSPYYETYSNKVGFDSLNKKNVLKNLIERQAGNNQKKFIRHDRIPGFPILSIIKRLGIINKEILNKCKVSLNRFYYTTFSREFAERLIQEIEMHKDANLVREEIEYIKWMLNSEQEFIKVEKIEIINNNEPVYDIELEPCKFFIAGNKPMNMFDTIRKFTKTPWTPIQLISFGTLSPEILAYLWILVQYKMNILITGGTSSGKTTLLNAIAFFIPPEARVVSIEDTRELNLPRDNWLPSVVRGSTGIGTTGEISLFDLLRSSFRQNPDYVIVGEVRGAEASVLFQGMASGHSSISTIHADSVDTLIKRLETPPIELSPTLLNVLDCVCIMTHAIVNKEETRKLKEVVEIINVTLDGIALTNTPFMWNPQENEFYSKKNSKIFEKIRKRYGMTIEDLDLEFKRRVQILYKLYQGKVFKFEEVQEIVNEYYKKPQEILNKFGVE